jgi:hypothetical protein
VTMRAMRPTCLTRRRLAKCQGKSGLIAVHGKAQLTPMAEDSLGRGPPRHNDDLLPAAELVVGIRATIRAFHYAPWQICHGLAKSATLSSQCHMMSTVGPLR